MNKNIFVFSYYMMKSMQMEHQKLSVIKKMKTINKLKNRIYHYTHKQKREYCKKETIQINFKEFIIL